MAADGLGEDSISTGPITMPSTPTQPATAMLCV
jgi:hypothetical protein